MTRAIEVEKVDVDWISVKDEEKEGETEWTLVISPQKMALSIILVYLVMIFVLFYVLSGCYGPSPYRLQSHFESETHASEVIQGKRLAHSENRLPIGMALIFSADSSHVPLGINDDTWPQFVARVNQKVQGHILVSMQEVVLLDEIPSVERLALLNDFKGMGEKTKIEAVLVVLPSRRRRRALLNLTFSPKSDIKRASDRKIMPPWN